MENRKYVEKSDFVLHTSGFWRVFNTCTCDNLGNDEKQVCLDCRVGIVEDAHSFGDMFRGNIYRLFGCGKRKDNFI